jgi:hypothetical protein
MQLLCPWVILRRTSLPHCYFEVALSDHLSNILFTKELGFNLCVLQKVITTVVPVLVSEQILKIGCCHILNLFLVLNANSASCLNYFHYWVRSLMPGHCLNLIEGALDELAVVGLLYALEFSCPATDLRVNTCFEVRALLVAPPFRHFLP